MLGDGKCYVQTSLNAFYAPRIRTLMNDIGYNACLAYDVTYQEMEYALYNSKILFSHSHGDDSTILMSDGNLYSDQILPNAASDLELAFFAACYAGNTFCPTLYNTGGAKAVVGFKDEVTVTGNGGGVHEYSGMVFHYLNQGYNIRGAVQAAKSYMYESYGDYYGCDSVVVYGNYSA